MAVEIGIASGHTDLLAKLETFLTTNVDLVAAGQEWEVFNTPNSNERVFKGVGLAGQEEIFFAVHTYENPSSDFYNWSARYLTGYDPSQVSQNQPGASNLVHITLWNQDIPYWFIANGRRAIVIAKISTVYACFYGGFILPYALPSEYPYPIAIGGNCGEPNTRWSASNTYMASFWNPGSSNSSYIALRLRNPAGLERTFSNFNDTSSSRAADSYTSPYANGNGGTWTTQLIDFRTSPSGHHMLSPTTLYTRGGDSSRGVWGEFDGVYHISGFQNASENVITINGEDYLVVQSSDRTTMHDYAAIKLV